MARKLIKRFLPDANRIRDHRHLRLFGSRLRDPNIWHVNRRSASGAVAIGFFMSVLPVPGHMLLAAAAAILFRVNLPLSVAAVWITNPLILPPIFFFSYKLGALILHERVRADVAFAAADAADKPFEPTIAWVLQELGKIWEPFLLGTLIVGGVAAAIGYFGMHWLWRWHVVRDWERRQATRRARSGQS
jgi:uncharacterized protein (DUF2062 family)